MPRKLKDYICQSCGNPYQSRKEDSKFCSNKCRAVSVHETMSLKERYLASRQVAKKPIDPNAFDRNTIYELPKLDKTWPHDVKRLYMDAYTLKDNEMIYDVIKAIKTLPERHEAEIWWNENKEHYERDIEELSSPVQNAFNAASTQRTYESIQRFKNIVDQYNTESGDNIGQLI